MTKHRILIPCFCFFLSLLMLVTPCVSAAEAEFNRFETIPTRDCVMDRYSVEEGPLYQTSAVFFGDSLCYARIERGDKNDEATIRRAGYVGRLATKYSMTSVRGLGSSGAIIADRSSNVIFKHMENEINSKTPAERKEVDFVILEGGVNDVTAAVPLGEIGTETDNFDRTTFAGAIQYTIKLAKESYPNAMVGFLIMYQMPAAESALRNDLENAGKYMNMIKEACIKWEVPYLDFFNDAKFNNEIFKVATTDCLTSDGVHMSVKGYDIITPYIASWMEEPIRRPTQPQKPIVTPDQNLPGENTPDAPAGNETPEPQQPQDPQEPSVNTTPVAIIVGVGIGVVVLAAAVSAILILKKKKK